MHIVMSGMLEQKSDGYYSVLMNCGHQMIIEIKGKMQYGLNLDGIDENEFVSEVDIKPEDVSSIETISVKRFHYMRELSMRRAKIQDLETILRLAQLIGAGREAGVVEDIGDQNPPPPSPIPPELVTEAPEDPPESDRSQKPKIVEVPAPE